VPLIAWRSVQYHATRMRELATDPPSVRLGAAESSLAGAALRSHDSIEDRHAVVLSWFCP
jgi:hypothetical protein